MTLNFSTGACLSPYLSHLIVFSCRRVQNKYDIVQKLGKGAYGVVWKAKDKRSRHVVALKKIFDAFQNSTDSQRTYREIVFLQYLEGHENIVQLHQVFRADNDRDIYLVFEYLETDLHAAIRANILEPLHKQYVMYQVCKALIYMHSAGLVHRDLKPANLLLNAECLMKLCDFGLCRTVSDIAHGEEEYTTMTDYVATRWYRAPEILLASKRYRESVDMWSLGCVFAEMIIGRPIFPGTSTLNQLERIIEKIGFPTPEERTALETQYSKTMLENLTTGPESERKAWKELLPSAGGDALSFVGKLICWSPEQRMTAEDSIQHPYCVQFHDAGTVLKWPEDKPKPSAELRFNDCEKKSANQYRNALYDNIREAKEIGSIRQKLR